MNSRVAKKWKARCAARLNRQMGRYLVDIVSESVEFVFKIIREKSFAI